MIGTVLSRFGRLPFAGRKPAFDVAEPPYHTPAGMILYAIGDIHGELGLLERLLDRIDLDISARKSRAGADAATLKSIVIFLGDYVDRGPSSREVIDRLMDGPLPGDSQQILLGNHEQAMLDFLADPVAGARWVDYGGVETLLSYGVPASSGMAGVARLTAARDGLAAAIPQAHLVFLRSLPALAVYGDYAFVHAGVRPGRPLAAQKLQDLLWIREPFLGSSQAHEKCIIHGHSISQMVDIRPNRIGVDTGAFASGILSAVVCQDSELDILDTRLSRQIT